MITPDAQVQDAWCDQYSLEDLTLVLSSDLSIRVSRVADSFARHVESTECLSCFSRHRRCADPNCPDPTSPLFAFQPENEVLNNPNNPNNPDDPSGELTSLS